MGCGRSPQFGQYQLDVGVWEGLRVSLGVPEGVLISIDYDEPELVEHNFRSDVQVLSKHIQWKEKCLGIS